LASSERPSRNPASSRLRFYERHAYAGIAVITRALWTLAPLAIVLVMVDRGVILREERYLERKFGQEYRRYKRQTRRWL
jgi:protein-S-isoprenylcysteine O-methyltransferase Ste14